MVSSCRTPTVHVRLLLLLLLLLQLPLAWCLIPSFPISVPVSVAQDGRGYIVQATLGRPPTSKQASLLLDTGNDYTWLSCDPVRTNATSCDFQRVTCDSPLCDSLSSYGRQCDPDYCTLSMQYGDGTTVISDVSIDVLTLGASARVSAFTFGAGTLVISRTMDASFNGLLGLGRGPLGFPRSTRRDFGGSFSYCLPASHASGPAAPQAAPGFLRLGGEGYVPGKKGCIGLSRKPTNHLDRAFYGLDLISLAVGNASLSPKYPIIVDSGTVFSSLETSLHTAVSDAIHSQLDHVFQSAPPDTTNGLYTCYYYNGSIDHDVFHNANIKVPPVVFNFDNGVSYGPLTLEQLFFREARTPTKFCLAISSTGTPFSVLGSFQQQRRLFTFDAVNSGVCIDQTIDAC